jgi:hypothetical protein
MKEKKKGSNKYIVDEKGSLGLLAIGYKGLRAWRAKKKESQKQKNEKEKK